MFKKFIVCLTDEKRKHLTEIITKGKAAAYKIKHANILLKADADSPNWNDETVADAFSVHRNTVAGIRQRFVEQGLEAALNRKMQTVPSRKHKFDGEGEARLISTGL